MRQLMRFQASADEKDSNGNHIIELKVIIKLTKEEALDYIKENNISVTDIDMVDGLDITDPYTINSRKKTKKEALEVANSLIAEFTKRVKKNVGSATVVDMKTGNIVGSESNL